MTESAPSYFVGSLRYTRAGLVALFGWLLWGDFVFSLMEAVMPSLLPLLLKSHGASNKEIVIIVSTLAMILNALLNPIISYASDRTRGPWGRRRPFIAVTTPFVVLFLVAIPFAPEILHGVSGIDWVTKLFALLPVAPIILTFGLLVTGFQIFNMFISSVYYYLIPDVVPTNLLGRFYGLFRIFGFSAGMGFNYFIFGLSEHYMKPIFVTIGLTYGFFIMLMCWRVNEGEYPPPEKEPREHWWSGIRNYAVECFGQPYYWLVYLAYSASIWAGASNVFSVFFYREQAGLSLDAIGKMGAWSGALLMATSYPFGILIDRWGCHKALIAGLSSAVVLSLLMFAFCSGPESTIGWTLARALPAGLGGMALLKWVAEVYPRERFGQFSSAGAVFSSLGGIILGPICGVWMDHVQDYRYFLIWHAIFGAISAIAALCVYQRWKMLGGRSGCPATANDETVLSRSTATESQDGKSSDGFPAPLSK